MLSSRPREVSSARSRHPRSNRSPYQTRRKAPPAERPWTRLTAPSESPQPKPASGRAFALLCTVDEVASLTADELAQLVAWFETAELPASPFRAAQGAEIRKPEAWRQQVLWV